MKKISLGSFPLISIHAKDRKNFESYMIKVLSDLITANQLSNSIYSDRVQYVTPISIMNFIKANKDGKLASTSMQPGANTQSDDRENKARVIKHAFKNTKMLYQSVSSDPFYKSHVFYPIYIEEAIKTNFGYSDYNYDFLILSNDLLKQQLVDEIIYDDKLTMLFLVLKSLLVPNLSLTEIGLTNNKDGQNFRKYFSVFLETCKNENINPFDMFIKLIKAAGKQKRMNVPGALKALSNRLTGTTQSSAIGKLYHSKSFINLFNTAGEIKDANFLLNEPLNKINEFLSDTDQIDPNYNPILRQYSQAKTHEYGKILSVIDSLSAFNKANNVLTELNSNSMMSPVNLDDGNTLLINKDTIAAELETLHFRRLLEEIIKLEEQSINTVRSEFKSKFKLDILGAQDTKETLTIQAAKIKKTLDDRVKDLKNLSASALNIASSLGFTNLEDALNEPHPNQAIITNYNNQMRTQTQIDAANVMLQDIQAKIGASQSTLDEVKNLESKKISLTVNLEILQAQLTALYSEIYQYIYSPSFDRDIITLKSSTDSKPTAVNLDKICFISRNSSDLNSALTTIEEIVQLFTDEIAINIKRSIIENSGLVDASKYDSSKIIEKIINGLSIKSLIINCIFIPIFTKYSNKSISDSNQLKDLKSSNNPLLRKILSDKSLFKAYILNKDTLVQSYELLHYIDTLKYEEGIINHPVSRVFNDMNKIEFMLKRLGLSNNPVFIFNDENILLSMPAHLSLTGINFISQIKTTEFVQFGQINWAQDLWNQNMMFGGPENSKEFKETKKNIEKIKDEISAASANVKKAQGDQKAKAKAEAYLKQKQDELRRKEDKLQEYNKNSNNLNFTSNLDRTKRMDNVTGDLIGPRQSGPYNAGMDSQGYHPHERDAVIDSRNGMDHLAQQIHPPRYQQPYPNQFQQRPQYQQPYPIEPEINPNHIEQPEPLDRTGFLNNQFIQNRINQLQ